MLKSLPLVLLLTVAWCPKMQDNASAMDFVWNTPGIDQPEPEKYADRILRWGFKFSEVVVGYTADHNEIWFDGFSR